MIASPEIGALESHALSVEAGSSPIQPSPLGRTVIARLQALAAPDRRHLNGHRRVLKRPLDEQGIGRLRRSIADSAIEAERIEREIGALRKRRLALERTRKTAAVALEAGEEQLVVAEIIDPDFARPDGGQGARFLIDLADFRVVGLSERDGADRIRFPTLSLEQP